MLETSKTLSTNKIISKKKNVISENLKDVTMGNQQETKDKN